ncbi:MAG TPA: hypothetical protein VK550_15310 [Polyangiaceae bacterium]|nr:hypothetical protein [Polyangiaceae bacterium]
MNERRARALKAGALAALACLGTCAIVRSRRPAPLPAPPAEAQNVSDPPAREQREQAPPRPSRETAAAPVIDAVTVEKDEVCEGEENLVTVQAHTADGNDAFLHYQVGAGRGSPVALRSYLDDRGQPTSHRVTVFGKNNVATSVPVPSFRVKRCDTAPAVVIEHHLRPNTVDEFDLDVRIMSTGAARADAGTVTSFRPRRFVWSFGDGMREESREPHQTHSFAARAQDTLYSHFLVMVEVLGEDGRALQGRHAIELLNPAFEAFAYKGTILLFADLIPRFPQLSASGVVDQGIRIWHTRPEVIAISKVTVTTRRLDGQRSPPAFPPVGSVLGATVVPPGRGIELHAVLDPRAEPDTLSRDYFLEGQTLDGHPVRGAFSVMKPPALPSKERHDAISDPVLLAKVKIAREVLHRDYVTDEDIWRLERAGQFDGLHVDARAPNDPPAAAKPATK